jgi:phage terminase large subunit-like protein
MAAFIDGSDLPLDAKRGIRAIFHQGQGPNRKPLGRIKVISADSRKNSGVIPSLVLVDELQAHPDGSLYEMFRSRLKKRGAQMVTISNAGWDEDSFLGKMRLDFHNDPSFTRKGMFNHAETSTMEFFEWCLGPGDDSENPRVVKKANPFSGVTAESLTEWAEAKGRIEAEWLRGACGIWTSAELPWLKAEDWDCLRVDVGALAEGESVYMAIRVGAGAGIAMAAPRPDGRIAVGARIIPAPEQGRISYEGLEWQIRRLAEQYNVKAVLYDAGQFLRSAEILQQAGIPMQEAAQKPPRYVEATATLWKLITAGLIVHDGDEALRREVLAGQTTETETGWRLVATEQTRALIAMMLAVHQASAQMDTPSYWAL